ncbi:MAG: AI-2E family transporter, partial [Bradyrhizobium sp.]
MTDSADNRLQARNDLAWAIAIGGIGIVLFAALLLFAWQFAATLFLLFAGMLLGVGLNAMTTLLGRLTGLPHALRLAIVCLAMAGLLSGIVFLGGTTIAQQATVLSNTIKSQLGSVKEFLEQRGVDTSYLDFASAAGEAKPEGTAVATTTTTPAASQSHGIPGAGALA